LFEPHLSRHPQKILAKNSCDLLDAPLATMLVVPFIIPVPGSRGSEQAPDALYQPIIKNDPKQTVVLASAPVCLVCDD
jgi:hypothetical protein